MAHPLESSYQWRPPVFFASVGAAVCCGVVLRGSAPGRGAVVATVLALWAVFVLVVWLRTRALLMVDGSRLTVRRYRRTRTVSGDQVRRVRQYLTPHGPGYRLDVTTDDGPRTLVAPVGLLRGGHSTLFGWLLAHAPQAELDRGSLRTLDQLRVRGLVT